MYLIDNVLFCETFFKSFKLLTFKVRAGSAFENNDPTLSWLPTF